jgi:hypothetical protein
MDHSQALQEPTNEPKAWEAFQSAWYRTGRPHRAKLTANVLPGRMARVPRQRATLPPQQVLMLRSCLYKASPEVLEKIPIGELSPKRRAQFQALVSDFADIFAESKNDLGRTNVIQHNIDLEEGTRPIRQRFYTPNPTKRQFIEEEVQRMQELGIVRESHSPWASPVVVVDKKTGDRRFCVDFRKLNNVTIKDSYPLPRIDDLLDRLGGASYYSSIDLQSGYWQVGMDPNDQHLAPADTGRQKPGHS